MSRAGFEAIAEQKHAKPVCLRKRCWHDRHLRRGAANGPGAIPLLVVISVFWRLNWPVMALAKIPALPFRAIFLLASGPATLGIAALGGARLSDSGLPRSRRCRWW